jgi:uncharacterized FAD-dependent dehydrogenase
MRRLAARHDLAVTHNPVDVGVRVEVPAIVLEDTIRISYDPKFYVRAPTYDDRVRTFCVSPHGYWGRRGVRGRGVVGVNGHSLRDRQSENTTLCAVGQREPHQPRGEHLRLCISIRQLATTIGGGKPILQSLGDLRRQPPLDLGPPAKEPPET